RAPAAFPSAAQLEDETPLLGQYAVDLDSERPKPLDVFRWLDVAVCLAPPQRERWRGEHKRYRIARQLAQQVQGVALETLAQGCGVARLDSCLDHGVPP